LDAIVGLEDLVAGSLEIEAYEIGDIPFILDD
jgi:hypothetical protein